MSITVNAQNRPTGFSGENAVDVFRIRVLASGLGLLKAGICPTRGLTKTKALKMATQYTGKPYKLSQIEEARADLKKIEQLRLQHIEIVKQV